MKYKIIGLAAAAIIIIISIFAPVIMGAAQDTSRVIQHEETALTADDEVNDGTFNSHLPLVNINTNGQEIPGTPVDETETNASGSDSDFTLADDGEKTILADMDIVDNETETNRFTDEATISSKITIRIRGNSSRYFDKKSYLIRLKEDDGITNNPQEVMGMGSHHEWVLYGPYMDKTLIRNYLWYNLAGQVMDYAPNVRFCEVMINGEYQGLYLMTETITDGDSRLPLTLKKKGIRFTGYLLRFDIAPASETATTIDTFSDYSMKAGIDAEIKWPGETSITDEEAEEIRQDFSDFEKALYSYDYDNNNKGWRDYIDEQSFIDYFIFNELTCNYDAGEYSTYIYKGADGKIRMCVWDFNNSCQNYVEVQNTEDFQLQKRIWYFMLMKDEDFVEDLIARYKYLRKNVLSDEYIESFIDDTVAYLGDAIDRNYEVWGYSFGKEFDLLNPSDRNPRSYTEAIDDLKTFIKERSAFMDENIDSLLQYAQMSKNKKFNEVSD